MDFKWTDKKNVICYIPILIFYLFLFWLGQIIYTQTGNVKEKNAVEICVRLPVSLNAHLIRLCVLTLLKVEVQVSKISSFCKQSFLLFSVMLILFVSSCFFKQCASGVFLLLPCSITTGWLYLLHCFQLFPVYGSQQEFVIFITVQSAVSKMYC